MRAQFSKSFPLICLLLAFGLSVVHAQQSDMNGPPAGGPPAHDGPPRGGPPSPAQELERLSQVLTLTDQQKSAILPILEKRHALIQQLMSNSTDREATHEQMRSIMESSNTEIRAQLTEEQQQLFDRMSSAGAPGSALRTPFPETVNHHVNKNSVLDESQPGNLDPSLTRFLTITSGE